MPKSNSNSLAKKIKMLRVEAELTQAQVAAALNISQQRYSTYEQSTAPDAEIIKKLCEFYGVSADYLLAIDVPTKKPTTDAATASANVNPKDLEDILSKFVDMIKEKK